MEFMGLRADTCPECGQKIRFQTRGGVRMGPVKSAIYDLIAGNPSIVLDDLHSKLSATRDMTRQTVRSHVNQMRDILADAKSDVKLITSSEHDGSGSVTRLRLEGGD
jgi:hypothetical protein